MCRGKLCTVWREHLELSRSITVIHQLGLMTSKLAVIRAHVQPCEFYCWTVLCFTHPSAAAHLMVFKSHHQRSKFLWCFCVIRWWAGEWQKCSSSCGDMGLSKRTVLCIRSLGLDEKRALQPTECQHLPKPESIVQCNTRVSCPADWTTGSWSEVSNISATRIISCS